MSRLIVFSNRIPLGPNPSGGLVVAVGGAMKQRGGLWIGTRRAPDEPQRDQMQRHPDGPFERLSMALDDAEQDGYYAGYSNSVLWPLCHGRVDLLDMRPEFFNSYISVNQRLARLSAPHIQPEDIIWIHDYHLIPLAQELRQLGVSNPIGYFHHIPFPSAPNIAALSEPDLLAQWFAAYDLVGLQTARDVASCIEAFRSLGQCEMMSDGTLMHKGRRIRVEGFPVGIHAQSFRTLAENNPAPRVLTASDQVLAIGVDRLDYSKGLPHKLRGLREYFRRNPESSTRLSLLQIASPTRESVSAYQDIRDELEGLSGEVNGDYGDIGYTPIQYIHRAVAREKVAGLFRASRIGLVTPLADGMNLVAKEYVAAQDPADPGVLVLSRFAGAAEQLECGAIMVNPHDPANVASGMEQALQMPLEERKARHARMWAVLDANGVDWWSDMFLQRLQTDRPSRWMLDNQIVA